MVATTAIAIRIELRLEALLAHVHDLPALAAEWDTLPDEAQAVESLSWDHLMADYLTELDEYYYAGQMTKEQAARYEELLTGLRAAMPIVEHLRWYRPPVSLAPLTRPPA